jgi:choice-of-anchor B domain-containing protein
MQQLRLLCLALALAVGLAPASLAQSTPDATTQLNGFSRALAATGSTVFVGEPQNAHTPGRVHLYTATADGAWSQTATLEAQDGAVGDGFGSALDADGTTLVVGAQSSGAAYVFTQDDEAWSQAARLTPPDSAAGYGTSVAVAGNQVFVGAASQDTLGAVFVYERQNDGTWSPTTRLVGSDVKAGDRFAATVAAQGSHLLVGAPRKSGGTVYAFHRDDRGTWTERQTLSSRLDGDTRFGSTLQMHGSQAVIGAPRAVSATGLVRTYTRAADTTRWEADGQLLPFDGGSRHLFGSAVALDSNGVWVGAPGASGRTGALYRFEKDADGGTWTVSTRLQHPNAEEGDMLGATVASTGQQIAVGLPGDDYGAGTLAMYDGPAGTWSSAELIAPSGGSALSAITGSEQPCTDGTVETEGDMATFDCENVDMLSFLPIDEIGGDRGIQVNDIWGWTDPQTDREYALVGRVDGASFVDVTNPTNPVFLGDLPKHDGSEGSVWRDIKVYENHAYIVADNAGDHGMQVFDLTQLRDVDPSEAPVTFEATTHYDKVNSAHNVVINTDTGFAYIVGSSGGGQTCGGGLHMVNIQDPANPQFVGCFADKGTGRTGTGYTHDAQCVIYNGPDAEYQGKEICFGANETAVSIADVSDKENPMSISTASYPDHAYVHQGWLTEDHRYFYLNDELDEIRGLAEKTRTLIWDVTDLDDPQLVDEFLLSEPSTDHNMYIKNNVMYQSNYVSGLRLVDVSNPTQPKEVGHFDTVPWGDNGPGFGGTWSNYPFFESGTIVMTSMSEGLFILKKSKQEL